MTSKELLSATLNHRQPDRVVVDFGATPVTGIHVRLVEQLRAHFGLEKRPVKVFEPYQMLGEVDEELREAMGVDVVGFTGRKDMFGIEFGKWKEFRTFWGQDVLVSGEFNTTVSEKGDLEIYPEGDTSVPPSGLMPRAGYFFDSIIRQDPIEEDRLNPEDNLEEIKEVAQEDLKHWREVRASLEGSTKGVVANFGGTALGDIALVPAPFLKHPKGIRDIAEWYMSTLMRQDYVHAIFDRTAEVAVANLEKYFEVVGNNIEVIFICGTDFGTQNSTFCAPELFDELWKPYYQRINNWVHKNTSWKTFKHSCGAVESFMGRFIEAGFDIINPVQFSATGMDTAAIKQKYGKDLTFWGGGVDTQNTLPYGTPAEIRKEVIRQCEILNRDGGFVFNTVHNAQANVPLENFIAVLDGIKEFNG